MDEPVEGIKVESDGRFLYAAFVKNWDGTWWAPHAKPATFDEAQEIAEDWERSHDKGSTLIVKVPHPDAKPPQAHP